MRKLFYPIKPLIYYFFISVALSFLVFYIFRMYFDTAYVISLIILPFYATLFQFIIAYIMGCITQKRFTFTNNRIKYSVLYTFIFFIIMLLSSSFQYLFYNIEYVSNLYDVIKAFFETFTNTSDIIISFISSIFFALGEFVECLRMKNK